MIRMGSFCLATAAWLAVGTSAHAGFKIDYASVQGSQIEFVGTGDTFSFVPTPGTDFEITSVTEGIGDSVGLVGSLGGTFTIGAIMSPFAGFEMAPVSGTGTLAIFDGFNTLTADISWVSIFTSGTVGGLNGGGVVNLSNIAYAGTVDDLMALASPQVGIITTTFQFVNPTKSLTDLTIDGAVSSTSYSGSISPAAAPEFASGLIWSVGLLAALGISCWFRTPRRICC